jgi:hypothetical protein
MKTSDLTGAALDWAVCSVEGEQPSRYTQYSTDWSAAGPIIERECIGFWWCDVVVDDEANVEREATWYAENDAGEHGESGDTPLIAAMRCYVASKLGDKVDVPNELTGESK